MRQSDRLRSRMTVEQLERAHRADLERRRVAALPTIIDLDTFTEGERQLLFAAATRTEGHVSGEDELPVDRG